MMVKTFQLKLKLNIYRCTTIVDLPLIIHTGGFDFSRFRFDYPSQPSFAIDIVSITSARNVHLSFVFLAVRKIHFNSIRKQRQRERMSENTIDDVHRGCASGRAAQLICLSIVRSSVLLPVKTKENGEKIFT